MAALQTPWYNKTVEALQPLLFEDSRAEESLRPA